MIASPTTDGTDAKSQLHRDQDPNHRNQRGTRTLTLTRRYRARASRGRRGGASRTA